MRIWKTIGFIVTALSLTGFVRTAEAQLVKAPSPSLKIDIAPELETVANNARFSVRTKITNVTKTDQALQVWSCSYDENWTVEAPINRITNLPEVSILASSCKKNGLINIKLKPGEFYQKELSLQVFVIAKDLEASSISFRLGFLSFSKAPEFENTRVWSGPVTIRLEPG